MQTAAPKQTSDRRIGLAILCGENLGWVAFLPGDDHLAGHLIFHMVESALYQAGLARKGEGNSFYGPTNQLRCYFTVSDIGAGLKCLRQTLADSPVGGFGGLARVYWHDPAESIWRGDEGAYDLSEADFWDTDEAIKFMRARSADLGWWHDQVKAAFDRQQAKKDRGEV